ncbi:hypothetical protein [Luteimonas terrae]|uniref:DUF1206 domain-containing protein n=1 Tax=Luteimonas terrae TaxID=1530191 RepID=A0ABU1XX61_9GAMM|nr:hypothetical protein [Luteimonas terrae]MDR7192711.1 hypothetical protein [Luteimonas terrae]
MRGTSAKAANEASPQKSKVLEATLELGRNWALATALAAFSVSTISQEAIYGVTLFKDALLTCGVVVAVAWYWLAIERAGQVAEFKRDTRRRKGLLLLGGTLLFLLGGAIVLAVASMADNRRFVQICSDYADQPDSGVYRDPMCQRLYLQRSDLADRLNRLTDRQIEP